MARKANTANPSWYMKNKLRKQAEVAAKPVAIETDAQIHAKLNERFDALELLTRSCIAGNSRSLIVSGPGGLGKSYTVEKLLKEWDPKGNAYAIVKGFIRATGLYQLLYKFRSKDSVLVFDDSDALFSDQETLGLLKCVCDTTENRYPQWHSETKMEDDGGEKLPTGFLFEGTIIFISNLDFDAMVAAGNKNAPHMEALISRSHYIDLAMKTRRDYIIRIHQVVKEGLLDHCTAVEKTDVISYIEKNQDYLREVSLRMALKIASLRRSEPAKWVRIANITCCKNR